MAKTPKLPLARYKRVAKDLAPISPKIAILARKKTLTGNDKRAITHAENKAHKWQAGSQRIIPLTAKQVKQLKDKSALIPGFNAVVDRNLGKTPIAEVKDGELYIRDNGRSAHIITVDSSNKEKFAERGAALFKGKKRRNVWVRFANGRSDTAFTDKEALLRFLVKVWEQYSPEWDKKGLSTDQMITGFEVYERGHAPPPKPKKTKKRKPSRKAAKPSKRKPSRILKIVKSRFKKEPRKPVKKAKLAKVKKFKPVNPKRGGTGKTKLSKVVKPRKSKAGRSLPGKKKNVRKKTKNRRH